MGADGASLAGGEERVEVCDVLVGADGIWSRVRGLLDEQGGVVPRQPQYSGYNWYRGLVSLDQDWPGGRAGLGGSAARGRVQAGSQATQAAAEQRAGQALAGFRVSPDCSGAPAAGGREDWERRWGDNSVTVVYGSSGAGILYKVGSASRRSGEGGEWGGEVKGGSPGPALRSAAGALARHTRRTSPRTLTPPPLPCALPSCQVSESTVCFGRYAPGEAGALKAAGEPSPEAAKRHMQVRVC